MHQKNGIVIINYIFLMISIILFIIISIKETFPITYLFSFIFIMLLTSLIFVTGMLIDKKETYERNINIYILLYFILLICLTMLIGRPDIYFINKQDLKSYLETINIIPFKTIINYLINETNSYIVLYNIFGNLITFIPISFLLAIKDNKYRKIKNQFIFLLSTVLLIETIQVITITGSFDIDDFILNVTGALLFFLIINKLNLFTKIEKLFYSDLNIKNIYKSLMIITLMTVIIIIDVVILIKLVWLLLIFINIKMFKK